MRIAVLAGGLATRLQSVARDVPKALVEVAGRPFIDHQLRLLRTQGYKEVVLCVGHLGEKISDYVGNGERWGMAVDYSFDGPVLCGTGGALEQALPKLGSEFFILYGDSYLPCDFRQVEAAFHSSGKSGLMTVLRNQNKWDASNVVFVNGVVLRHNKKVRTQDMQFIDYGLSCLKASVFSQYPSSIPYDLSDLFGRLADAGDMGGFQVHQRFYEIGSPAGLAETREYFLKHSSASQYQ
jgi:MurNAc alpha-1-phosphate uridylyltransferase